ncbi:unnamed protein product [Brassicogethes aeneus]|uniref:Uncharacterized protein n=1 Tax=Brassicogethes aeneus TaxID=1431903 RepID=A0A9P0AZ46_BRAAE|nr:unnamed protein product [Brassicogethes aeneus]
MNPAFECLENIRSDVFKKTLSIVEIKAYIKCYEKETKNYREKTKDYKEKIRKIDREIMVYKVMNEKLSKVYETSKETFNLSLQSSTYLQQHIKTAETELKDVLSKQHEILNKFSKIYDDTKERLQKSSPLYREMQELSIEVKLTKFNCLDLQAKININQKINKQRQEIGQKLFYNDIIKLANAWVNHQKYLKAVKDLEKAQQLERENLRELLEVQEEVKRVGYNRSKNHMAKINEKLAIQNNSSAEDEKKIDFWTKELEYNKLFKQPSMRVEPQNNNKVRIIEDVVINMGIENNLNTSKSALSFKREEKRKNLQKLFKKYAKRSSRQNSFTSDMNASVQNLDISQELVSSQKSVNECKVKKSILNTSNHNSQNNTQNFTPVPTPVNSQKSQEAPQTNKYENNPIVNLEKKVEEKTNNKMEPNKIKKSVKFELIPEKNKQFPQPSSSVEFGKNRNEQNSSIFFSKKPFGNRNENTNTIIMDENVFKNPIPSEKFDQFFQTDNNNFTFTIDSKEQSFDQSFAMENMSFNMNFGDSGTMPFSFENDKKFGVFQ